MWEHFQGAPEWDEFEAPASSRLKDDSDSSLTLTLLLTLLLSNATFGLLSDCWPGLPAGNPVSFPSLSWSIPPSFPRSSSNILCCLFLLLFPSRISLVISSCAKGETPRLLRLCISSQSIVWLTLVCLLSSTFAAILRHMCIYKVSLYPRGRRL